MSIEFPEKLAAFTEVPHENIQPGGHFRYTYNKFQGNGERTCVYGVCTERSGADIWCKGYKSTYEPWKLDPDNRYKQFRFYMKVV